MFKVLIVDDEPIIRKGLKNIVKWADYGCEVCGEASFGEEGISLIKEFLPDIIFTDIKMKEMSGLTMIKQVKSIVPDSIIIILTGYRDFEYVQEALKLGAFDFVLKPSKVNELNNVVERAVNKLNLIAKTAKELESLKKNFEQHIPELREKLLYEIICGINKDKDDIQSKMNLYDLKSEHFVLVVLEKDDKSENEEESVLQSQFHQIKIVEIFNNTFLDAFKVISVVINSTRTAFLVQQSENNMFLYTELCDKCACVQEGVHELLGMPLSIGISSEGDSLFDLEEKYMECHHALEHKFYIGNNCIICYQDIKMFFNFENQFQHLSKYKILLLEGINAGNIDIVLEQCENIRKDTNKLNLEKNNILKNFYWDMLICINEIRLLVLGKKSEGNIEEESLNSLRIFIFNCNSINDLNDLLKEVAYKLAFKINNFNNKSINLKVEKAVEFICEYYDKPITLNEVAETMHVSTYYASRIFKKDLGKNFKDYLNEVRIEKAKDLLMNIEYKTYEVADMVGIPDEHYFSKLFKKYTTMSPSEYRTQQN